MQRDNKRRKHGVRSGSPQRELTAANQVWALDFAHEGGCGENHLRLWRRIAFAEARLDMHSRPTVKQRLGETPVLQADEASGTLIEAPISAVTRVTWQCGIQT